MRVRIAIAGTVVGTAAGIGIGRAVRWWRTWGFDPKEAARSLPGDELVPTPTAIDTRGITIDAPPQAVWPWLVQMGFDRAGWYSYDQLDMRGKSLETIVPKLQDLAVGDVMPMSPNAGFEVRILDPGRALVLYADTALIERQTASAAHDTTDVPAGLAASGTFLRQTPQEFVASWTFSLEPLDGGRTRLIERFRVRFGPSGPGFRFVGPIMGFGVFVMMQRQMLGIRARALRTALAPPLPPVTQSPPRGKANGHVVLPGPTEVLVSPAG